MDLYRAVFAASPATLLQAGLAGNIDDSRYPGCSAVYQTPGADPKQRWWHVLDNAFILPEYIAEVCLTQPAGEDVRLFLCSLTRFRISLLARSLTHSLTHSLNHSLARSLTHSLYVPREAIRTLCAELLTISCVLEVTCRTMLLSQPCLVGLRLMDCCVCPAW